MSTENTLRNVRFLNGGYCQQSIYLSGVRSWGFRRFQAVFMYFEHPSHGRCLIDCGYGPQVFRATQRLPQRVLRWLTPIPKRQAFLRPDYLESQKLDASKIERVFISHFHADHIGGLDLFPTSKLIYRREALEWLQEQTAHKQLREGFLPDLLPSDFDERSTGISKASFEPTPELSEFTVFDFWGDGSLLLLDLPGHAIGHTGFLLETEKGKVLYVVDAFWDHRVLSLSGRLPWLSRQVQHDFEAYQDTQVSILKLAESIGTVPLACHCPETQAHVR